MGSYLRDGVVFRGEIERHKVVAVEPSAQAGGEKHASRSRLLHSITHPTMRSSGLPSSSNRRATRESMTYNRPGAKQESMWMSTRPRSVAP
jgi:hypothetical protein